MSHSVFQRRLFTLLMFLLSGVMPVFAADDSLDILGFVEPEKSLVSTSRIPRPTSQIAENITVITAEQIATLNAHTLAEVLQTVPGIQFDYLRTPSTFSYFNVQGAYSSTVLVLIDGIRQNDFQQGIALTHLIPVQQIERIEIIKGAASAAWGSALGGVINIITKTPNPDRHVSGIVSGSMGTQFTADSRAELSGTLDRFGYYLTAGNLRSDGLSPNNNVNLTNLYGKLSYRMPRNGTVTLGLSKLDTHYGMDEGNSVKWGWVHDNDEDHHSSGFLKLSQPLRDDLTLDIDGNFANRDGHVKWGGMGGQGAITFFNEFELRENTRGSSARLIWGDSQRNLTTGIEYGHANARSGDLLNPSPTAGYERNWDNWAFYGNGAWAIERLAILPGIRYDMTGIAGDKTSYTLGATYRLAENTTLRAYYADGFSLPQLLSPGSLQQIKTFQSGIESGAVPYLWLKGTLFYNTLRNSQDSYRISSNQNRKGFEIEGRTTPLYNFSLTSGYTYLYATNSDTGERLKTDSSQSVPPHVVKLALNYNHPDLGLRGALTGNYVWWNSPVGSLAASKGMILDLHLNWKVCPKSELSPELFFSGHNLFNGVQTTETDLYTNPTRWFEGGLRVNF